MPKLEPKVLAIFAILLLSYYYIFAITPLFNIQLLLLTVGVTFLYFHFVKPEAKQRIMNFLESRSNLLFIFLLLLSLAILYNGGLFKEGIVVFQDYSFHYFRTYLLTHVLLPKFGSVVGWTQYFQAGMPEFYDYPPLSYLITSGFYYLLSGKVLLETLFRITIAIAFLLPTIGIYKLTKTLTQKKVIALFAAFLWLGFPHNQFVYGNYTTYFALGWVFLGLSFFFDYLKEKKLHHLLLSTTLFAFTLLSNPMILVPTFFVIIFSLRKLALRDFLVLSIGIFLISFIWFVQIYEGYEYLSQIHTQTLLAFPEWFNIYNQFFVRFLYLTPAVFFLIFIGMFFKTDKSIERLLHSLILIIIFLIAVEQLQPHINFLSTLQPEKTVLFLRGIMIIVTVFFAYTIVSSKEMSKNRLIENALSSLIVTAIILSSLVYLPYLLTSWSNVYDSDFVKIVGYYKSFGGKEVFSYAPLGSLIETFDFIKRTATVESRILFENSKEGNLGYATLSLGPLLTGKNFIGGQFFQIELNDQNANAISGKILGKSITNYTAEEFESKLNAFNIGYIAAWSNDFVSFLKSHPETLQLRFTSSDNFLYVFEYAKSEKKYAASNNKLMVINTIVIDDNLMEFEIKNARIGDKILLKETYNTHWKVFVDEESVKPDKEELHLMSIKSPRNGDYTLKIVYEKTPQEIIAPIVTLLSLITILVMAAYYKWKLKK